MRRAVTAIACVTLVLAGCLAPASPASPGGADGPIGPRWPTPPHVTERVAVDAFPLLGFSAGESFISVSPDGQTVLTCTHGSFVEDSPSYASQDAGATWRRVEFPVEAGVGGDCETAIMADGTWAFLTSTIEQNTVITTADEGATFTWSNFATWPTNTMADRPWLESVGDRLLLTFMPLSPTAGWIGFTRSDDKAATWSFTEHITSWQGTHVGVMHGHIQVHDDQQRVWVPFMKYDQPSDLGVGGAVPIQGVLGYAFSDNRGDSWTEVTLTSTLALAKQPPTMAVSGDRLYLVHQVPGTSGWDLVLWYSADAGETWHEPMTVVDGMADAGIHWIDGAGDGTATYLAQADGADFGYDAGTHQVGIRLDADVPGFIAYTQDFGAGANEFTTVDHDAAGLAFVSYGTDGALWFTREVAAP